MRITDHARLSPATLTALAHRLDGLGMLGDLVRWMPHQPERASILDVVVQDEFTHDVIVSLAPHYLVFDTT